MSQGIFFQFGVWFGFFGILFGCFVQSVLVFNPDLLHLLEVCTIPAGLATFSIVFIGLQTSILCFLYVIFISSFGSKLR